MSTCMSTISARASASTRSCSPREPTRVEGDYAKWMLDDPRINFAISTRGSKPGIDHLGFQTDDSAELAEMKARAESADMALLDEGETTCCYARSEKHWVTDPQGIAWEHFHTLGNIPVFNQAAGDGAAGDLLRAGTARQADRHPGEVASHPAADRLRWRDGRAPAGPFAVTGLSSIISTLMEVPFCHSRRSDRESRHQWHGAHRPSCPARCAGCGGTTRGRPPRGQPPGGGAPQRTEGRRRRHRPLAGVRQRAGPLAHPHRRRRRCSHSHRRSRVGLLVARDLGRDSLGRCSASTWCSSAPASS